MNQALSARSEGIACDAVHSSSPAKRTGNIWLVAAHQVLETLGLSGRAGGLSEADLYVTTDGDLVVLEHGQPPTTGVYVCRLRRGADPVVIAARLRHVASRWRKDYPANREDND